MADPVETWSERFEREFEAVLRLLRRRPFVAVIFVLAIAFYGWHQFFKDKGDPKPTSAAASAPPASATGETDLCPILYGQSIDFTASQYHGKVGAQGINVRPDGNFDTEVLFSGEDVVKEFGGVLRDPVAGNCGANTIKLDRTLRNGTHQVFAGRLFQAATGKVGMEGKFLVGGKPDPWSGWIVTSSKG